MKKRIASGVLALSLVTLSLGSASASAAVEFGDPCVANEDLPAPYTLFEVAAPGNPLPLSAPTSGVLTRWKVNIIPTPVSLPMTMKVLRLNGAASTATVIGESTGAVFGGANTVAARIPIQAGDYVGVSPSGPFGALICETAVDSTIGFAFVTAPGSPPGPYELEGIEFRVPMVGVIEPDVDGDGYGDETQDGCPQSALYHTPCPVIVVNTINLAGKSAAKVLVATSSSGPVKVSGTVKLGKGATAKLSAKPKTVPAGKLVGFKLQFPGSLMERLEDLPPSQKLTLKVTAKATNVAGQVSTDKSNAKLKGQG